MRTGLSPTSIPASRSPINAQGKSPDNAAKKTLSRPFCSVQWTLTNRRTVWVFTSYGYSAFLPATTVSPHLEVRFFGLIPRYDRCRRFDVTVTLTVTENVCALSRRSICWFAIPIILNLYILSVGLAARVSVDSIGWRQKSTKRTSVRLNISFCSNLPKKILLEPQYLNNLLFQSSAPISVAEQWGLKGR